MWLLLKKFYRDLGESRGQFISVLAVVTIGAMFYTGLHFAVSSFAEAGDRYVKEYRLADLWASLYRAPESTVKRLAEIPGVSMTTGRLVKDARVSMADREATVRLISLPDEKSAVVNDIQLRSGSYFSPADSNQCIVSENFFKANDLSFGQVIEPIINGDRVKLKVVGTAKSAEYIYEVPERSELVPNPQRFGVVYVKKSFLQNILDYKGSVNDIAVLFSQDGDVKKIKDEVEKVLRPYGLISLVERKDQLSYATYSGEITSLQSVSSIFPMLFFIASAVIIYITMTRMIENQRTLMGVMKALGYSNIQIMLHYQTYPLLVGLLGSAAGALIGISFVGSGLIGIFNLMYNLPVEKTAVDAGLVLPAALLALFFCAAAGYNACRRELKLVPAQAMRPRPPAAGKKIFLENIRLLWRRVSFSWKLILRNLFRYKKRSAMASLGIIFAMALLLVALGMKDSMDGLMKIQFSEIEKYDLKISLDHIMDSDELSYISDIEHIAALEPVLESGMEMSHGWMKKDIGLLALEPGAALYGILDREGRPAALPEQGILLPVGLMDAMQLKVGDKAYLRSFYPGKNEEENKKAAPVMGAVSQFMGQSAVCSVDYVHYLLNEGAVVNAAYIKLDDPRFEQEVTDRLKGILSIGAIKSKAEIVANTQKALETVNTIVAFMILGTGVLAFAVIYNIANINIFERRREIATLSVLGFNAGELKSLVFNENYFISALGIIVGILPGRLLLQYVVAAQNTEDMQMPMVLDITSCLAAAVLLIVFTITANLLLGKKVTSINMVESLKSAE